MNSPPEARPEKHRNTAKSSQTTKRLGLVIDLDPLTSNSERCK
jgi:hypothetical protein